MSEIRPVLVEATSIGEEIANTATRQPFTLGRTFLRADRRPFQKSVTLLARAGHITVTMTDASKGAVAPTPFRSL